MLTLSLLGLAARSLGLLFLASVGGWMFFRSSAAMRRVVWLIAIVAVLALPAIWRVSPAAKVPSDKIPGYLSFANRQPVRRAIGQIYDYAKPPKVMPQIGTSVIDPNPTPVNPIALMLCAWAGVTALLTLRLIYGLLLARRLIASSMPFPNPLAQSVVLGAHLRRPVRVLLNDNLAVPAAAGILRPVVLLPKGAAQWPADKLEAVLAHELAHIKQNDWIFNVLAQLACAMYPFNPFVWLCASRLRNESELAADDRAVLTGITPKAYASTLLDIAASAKRQPATVVAMARRPRVEGRVKSIMNPKRERGSATLVPMFAAGLAAATTCGAIAAFRIANPTSLQELGAGTVIDYNSMATGWKGPFTVRVLDENGKPCPGVGLQFNLMAPMGIGSAQTESPAVSDKNGEYHVDPSQMKPQTGEPAGFFRSASIVGVMAYLPGHALTRSEGFFASVKQVVVRLAPSNTARIHVLGPDGRPAAGVMLTATRLSQEDLGDTNVPLAWRSNAFKVTTDANGIALFRDLPAGNSVSYDIDDDRYLPTSRYQHNPPVSGVTEYPTLHLVASGTIEGHLRLAGKPLSGIRLQFNSAGDSYPRQATSDSNGYYRLTRVPFGLCDVHYIERPSPAPAIPSDWVAKQQDGLQISAGQNLSGIDFDFEKCGRIRGSIVDENGRPQDLGVSATSPKFVEFKNGIAGNPPDFFSAGDSEGGHYEIRLPAGRYKLQLGIGPNPPEKWVEVRSGEITQAGFQVDIKSRTRLTGNLCAPEEDE